MPSTTPPKLKPRTGNRLPTWLRPHARPEETTIAVLTRLAREAIDLRDETTRLRARVERVRAELVSSVDHAWGQHNALKKDLHRHAIEADNARQHHIAAMRAAGERADHDLVRAFFIGAALGVLLTLGAYLLALGVTPGVGPGL